MNSELEEIKQELAQVSKAAAEFNDYKKTKGIRIRNIIIIVLAILLILSNVAWAIYEHSMETVTETTTTYDYEISQDNENGDNNYIGNNGDITYGETKNKSQDN